MSAAIGVSVDGVRIPLARTRVARVAQAVVRAERVRDAMLSITFVSDPVIRRLNRRHLGRGGRTDVIAFGLRSPGPRAPIIGDVYIAPGLARASAAAHGITLREELIRLIVHGTLHVLGYDHPEGATRTRSAMWRRQERLVRRLARSRAS